MEAARIVLEVERAWRDMKSTLELRPVYHRLEDRIRAHIVLCWLAPLLIRLAETGCHDTWRNLRHELDRMHLGTFSGPAGTSRQRTDTTHGQRAILKALDLPEPPRFVHLQPAPSDGSSAEPVQPSHRHTRPFRVRSRFCRSTALFGSYTHQ